MANHQFPPSVISLIKKQFEKHDSVAINDGVLDLIMGVESETAKRPIKSRLGPNPNFGGNLRPGTSVRNIVANGDLPRARANENNNPLFRIFRGTVTKKNETVTLNRAKPQGGGTAAYAKKVEKKQVLSKKQLDDELEQYRKQRDHQKKTSTTEEDLDKEMDEYRAVLQMKKQLKVKMEQQVQEDGSEPMEIAA